jgi:hypothetical protein
MPDPNLNQSFKPQSLEGAMSKKIIDALKDFNSKSLAKIKRIHFTFSKGQEAQNPLQVPGKISDSLPACLSFLSLNDLLKWAEEITKSAATVYDKAMDKNYLLESVGGGNHRMFDGGHDLAGAWEAVKNVRPDDTFQQEVIGYASGIWKDLTTVKGLPFTTWKPKAYNECADWVASYNIPGASKDWFYDLMSCDALEVVGASMGTASVLFFFSESDKQRVSEIIGSMGAVSVASANPLMGVALVFCVAYSYFVKKQQFDTHQVAVGAGLAGISTCIFAVLTFPVLIELGIAITVTALLRRHVITNEQLI